MKILLKSLIILSFLTGFLTLNYNYVYASAPADTTVVQSQAATEEKPFFETVKDFFKDFWAKHKTKILIGIVLLGVILLFVFYSY